MKRLLLLLALTAGSAFAQLKVSDFSHFTPDAYSNFADGPWSAQTAQSGATLFTIADFGQGAPSGQSGNGFLTYFETAMDWSDYDTVSLGGIVLPENATVQLSFYLEDIQGNIALTTFELSAFGVGANTTVSIPLLLSSIDATQVSFWGFVVGAADAPSFGFSFDQVQLSAFSAVPEPSTYGAFAVAALVGVACFRRRVRRLSLVQS